jgi:hypothetical protein
MEKPTENRCRIGKLAHNRPNFIGLMSKERPGARFLSKKQLLSPKSKTFFDVFGSRKSTGSPIRPVLSPFDSI